MVVKAFIIMILEYSAKKNSAKGPLAYSTLKPETSSDSPSVKSKGARFVSARVEMNHIIVRGHAGKINQICSWVVVRVAREKEPLISRTASRIMASVTSYEIVWATARRAPIRAYFELDAHPDHMIVYTARLDSASINRIPRFMLVMGCGMGRGVHMVRARVRARMGAMMNIEVDDVMGRRGSLVNNLIASAIGCSRPQGPTMFGPFRSCMYPSIFRSRRMRNATARRTGIIVNRVLIRDMFC